MTGKTREKKAVISLELGSANNFRKAALSGPNPSARLTATRTLIYAAMKM